MTIATATVYDCIGANVGSLPVAAWYAGYVTGTGGVPWSAQQLADHPGVVRIDQSPVNTTADETADVLDYETLLAAEAPGFAWPEVDERSAAAMCYTSGTTGNPKGVVYSHRSTVLHSMAACFAQSNAISERERILLIVPMFHANAWGLPYAGWLVGADLHMPARFLQAEPLSRFIAEARPTYSAAVPTIWADMLRHAKANPVDLSSIRTIICGGSAVPRPLIEDRKSTRLNSSH